MTSDNTQELDEILQRFYRNTGDEGMDKEWVLVCHSNEVRALLDWHNKQILEMLKDEQDDNERSVSAFKYMWRNKLKENN